MTKNQEALGLDLKSYLDQIVQSDIDKFNAFITWTDDDKKEFRSLLDALKKTNSEASKTTK